MKPSLYLPLLSLAVSGCSSPILNQGPDEATLADLQSEPVKIEKSAIAPSERKEVIENYRELLKLKPDQRLHSEATRRLADLELEQSETKLLSEDQAAQSVEELNQSVELYKGLLEKDPDYAASDLVLYQLARAYELQGDMPAMMQALNSLTTKYPQSGHWKEARFRQGERFFVEQKFHRAEQAYGDILKLKNDNPFFDRSLFKHGWSLFKQRKVEQGLDSFTQLLDENLSDADSLDKRKLSAADQDLLKETLRVISLTFSELGGTQRISQYFERHGHRNYEYMIYQGLGNLYIKQERIQDAADAYQAFVNLNPAHPQSPRLSVEVVEIYTKNGFPAKAIESKKSFIQHYAVSGDAWNKLAPNDQPWLNQQLRVYLKDLAEYHHALAQRNRKQGDKKITAEQAKQGSEAAHWYRLYLDAFPADPKAGNISFLLGELLFELENYTDAVVAYEQSAYQLPNHEQKAEAGYAALLAYAAEQKNLSKDPDDAWQKKGVESALRFCDSFPKDPRRARVLTEAADQLLDLKDLGRARGAALQVTNLQPPAEKKLQRTAWVIAAHAAFEQKDFAAAEQAYQQALAMTRKSDQQRTQLEERLAASIYQQGSDQRSKGDHGAAAKQFLRISALAPASTILATAEYDAAASLIAAGDWASSVKILESYKKRYPKSELIPEVNSKLAVGYMETGHPLKAASQLTLIAKQSSNPELQREAGWQAAELYEKAGKKRQAIASYKRYVKQFPKPFDQALEGRQKLVELYQQTKEIEKRDWWLKQIVKVDAKAGKQRTDRSRYLAATANIQLAEPARLAFRKVKLKAPLEKSLKSKKSKMQAAIDMYKKAAAYGVAEVTTAATHRIGEIYQHFGAALMASDRPKGLNAEELEQYDILLEEQAYPFEEKAIKLYESNIERTPQGIYDKWVKKSFDALAKLIPGRYAKQEKGEVWIDALN